MMRPYQFILLVSLMMDGGSGAPQPNRSDQDAGPAATQSNFSRADAGGGAAQPSDVVGIRWPEDLRPLAVLDGPAVIAANAALQHLLVRLSKEYGATCPASAKAMEVFVGQEGGVYFVRIDQHVEKCSRAAPGFATETDWFELYAVSPEGKVLARYPNAP